MSLTINVYFYSTQGHVDSQASLGSGELQLPNSSSCVAKTKSGKPATTRKKNKELLQKYGFDVLGQSFGIPSRADFEKEALMNTPPRQTAHRRSFSASPSDQDLEVYLDEDSSPRAKLKPVHHKKASPPSSSEKRVRRKPGQTVMYPENFQLPVSSRKQGHIRRSRSMSQSTTSSSAKDSRKQMVMYMSDDDEDTDSEITQSSTSFCLPQPPPPPNIPRQSHTAYYPTHPTMAGYMPVVYPMAGNGYHAAQGPAAPPFPAFYYVQPFPQYSQAVGSNMYPQGFATNQVGSLPAPSHFPQQQLGNMVPSIPPMGNIAASLVPPPPPPPPPRPPIVRSECAAYGDSQAEIGNDKAASVGGDEPAHDSNLSSGQQQDGPSFKRNPSQSIQLESKTPANNPEKQQGESAAAQDDEKPSGFPYKHVCAGCGKTRSNGYHMTHRLKKGETAEPDYCRRCVAAAAFTDSEAPSMVGYSQLLIPNLSDARPAYEGEKENDSKPRMLPKSRAEQTNTSATDNGQAVQARKKPRYKQPTVRNEASELANRALDSSALEDNHTYVLTQSYEGLPDNSLRAPNERAKPSDLTTSAHSPDETIFPKFISSVLEEEANLFGEYDSPPMEPDNAFGSIPPTPTDRASSSHDTYPYIVNDSWGYEQSHFEKMAEELAEEDLMRAGKRSGLFDSSRDSSTASSNPFFGNLTPSLISIESCPSDEERTDGNDHYEMAAGGGSDGEEDDTATGKKSPKQLEFSSSEDHVRNTAKYKGYADNRHNNVKTTGYRMPDARNMYNHYDMESTLSSHSSDFQPPVDGSSLLAHTGHSMDDTPLSGTRAPRRRLRHLGGLLRP
ncbi:hypothetical protein PG993_001520 [Apiospora rasikravindrae]|uniref:Uncharacterized protein n=1 Tax=Apiospora rasikravindrae TaxID=990691 RepID=A0ABR1UBM0_9PEZI